MKEIKTKKQLEKRLKQLDSIYNRLIWVKEVTAINEFLKNNKEGIDPPNYIEKIVDNRCLSGAWIYDRIQSKTCTIHNPQYKGSLTKKIRNALEYTF